MSTFSKITKYLLLIAAFFATVSFAHLVFVYCYHDSRAVPEAGGTVGIGLVGDAPSLDPLKFGTSENADVALRFLFRSLLRYDAAKGQVVGDIANCDLGTSFSLVRCYLKDGGTWSDGSPITKEDVIATYDALRGSDKNPAMRRIVEQMAVSDKGEYLEFSTKNPDLEILAPLTFPIVKKQMVERLAAGAVEPDGYVSSGPYEYAGVSTDETTRSTSVSLVRSETTKTEARTYIGRYVLRFYPDAQTLSKNEDVLNVILEPEGSVPPSSPRFEPLDALLPQYVSLFLNSERLPKEVRNLALVRLDAAKYPSLDPARGLVLRDALFGTGGAPVPVLVKNPEEAFAKLGYYRRDRLVKEYEKDLETLSGQIAKATAERATPVRANPVVTNKYFNAPTSENMYFFSGDRTKGITLGGTVPADVTAVFVNGYKLSRYAPGSGAFSYLANAGLGNLRAGANAYHLAFERGGNRETAETLTVYAAENDTALTTLKAEVIGARSTATSAVDLEALRKRAESLRKSMENARSLDPAYYYDRDLVRYSVKLVYTGQARFAAGLVADVTAALKDAGIAVTAKEISLADVKTYIETGAKDYDMILTGIHLGMFGYDVFPFFHSGQAQVGFNFSKIKSIPLDVQLESLKFRIQNPEKLEQARKSILEILRQSDVVRPFYSSYQSWYVDRNISGRSYVRIAPSPATIADILLSASVSKRHEVDWTTKSASGFFVWLYHGMFP